MYSSILITLAALLAPSLALRRACKHIDSASEGWYYTTSSDTLDVIAADFCTTADIIKQWNNIDSFEVGVSLKVPCHWNSGSQRDCAKNSDLYGAYVIVSGDELQDIAYDFCTTSDVLQSLNSEIITNKDFILTGDVIQVPCSWN